MSRIKSKKYVGVYYQTLQNKDKAYYITYKENNKKIWLKIGLHSEGVREAYCNEKRGELTSKIRTGEDLPEVAKRNIITLSAFAEVFYDNKEKHNRQNKKTRARITNHIEQTLGNFPLNKITEEHIEKIQTDLAKRLAPATVNFIIGQLSAIFNTAMKK